MGQRHAVPVPALLALAAAALFASAFVIGAQNSTVAAPQMDSYAGVDARTITIRVYVASCSWTRVANAAESSTAVRVTVETLACPVAGAGTDALDLRELNVPLAGALGMRAVEDLNGETIPQRWTVRRPLLAGRRPEPVGPRATAAHRGRRCNHVPLPGPCTRVLGTAGGGEAARSAR